MKLDGLFSALEERLSSDARKAGSTDTRRRIARVAQGGLLAATLLATPLAGQQESAEMPQDSVESSYSIISAYQEADRIAQDLKREVARAVDAGQGSVVIEKYRRQMDDLFRVMGHHNLEEGQLAVAENLIEALHTIEMSPGDVERVRDSATHMFLELDRRDSRVNRPLREIREQDLDMARSRVREKESDVRSAERQMDISRRAQRETRGRDGILGEALNYASRSGIDRARNNLRDARRELNTARRQARRIETELSRLGRQYVPGVHRLERGEVNEDAQRHLDSVMDKWSLSPDGPRAEGPRP